MWIRLSERGNGGWCRGCDAAYKRAWYEKNRETHKAKVRANHDRAVRENRARVLEYLWTHSCVDCGESDPIILEFDHVTGKKRESISLAVSRGWSWAAIEAE